MNHGRESSRNLAGQRLGALCGGKQSGQVAGLTGGCTHIDVVKPVMFASTANIVVLIFCRKPWDVIETFPVSYTHEQKVKWLEDTERIHGVRKD